MDEYSTHELGDGTVLQAGTHTGEDGSLPWDTTAGFIARGVVLQTYYHDDPGWKERGWTAEGVRTIACDVRVFGKQNRTLYRVPVAQPQNGLWDEDVYIPRGASQDLSGGDLATEGTPGKRVTSAQNLDGDHVLVGFLECDPKQPVILPFTLGHPQAKHLATAAEGRRRRTRHAGTLVEWTEDGDYLIDATAAAQPRLGPKGTEVARTAGQKITITVGTQKVEVVKGSRVKITSGSSTIEATATMVKTTVAPSSIEMTPAKIDVLTPTFGVITSSGSIDLESGSAAYLTGPSVILGDRWSGNRGALIKFGPEGGEMDRGWNGLVSQLDLTIPVLSALPPNLPVMGGSLSGLVSVLEFLRTAATGMISTGQCSKVFGV